MIRGRGCLLSRRLRVQLFVETPAGISTVLMETRRQEEAALPLISVIMPCYNAQAFLREAVECVLSQSHPQLELIVVDDGSTDRSKTILREYGNRLVCLEQANAGPYFARNHGLSHARGDFVAFLDADDWWRSDFLERMLKALKNAEDAAAAYCGWQNVGADGGRGEPYVPPDYEQEGKTERFLRAASPWPIHAALVRREAVDEVGGFGTYLRTCMDYDFWLRIGLAHPIVRVPDVMAFYRHHREGQIISKQWRQAENTWAVKKRFVAEHPDLMAGLDRRRLRQLIDGGLLRRGYDNYWRRDLVSARHIFRLALRNGSWGLKDLKYLLPALLPERAYLALIGMSEKR